MCSFLKINNLFKLILAILICESAGILGSFFTISAISNWYQFLNKPSFSPPNFIFGPVWIILYFLMGISLFIIWSVKKKQKKDTLTIFWVHLFFNATWSIMFFGLKNPLMGLLNILILWVLIIIVIYKFWKLNKWAAALLLPYLAWVSFATVLNYTIWIINS